jgi:hypothetical protein
MGTSQIYSGSMDTYDAKAAGGEGARKVATAAIAAVVASSDGACNVRAQRLFTMEEVIGIRKKRIQLQKSYSPPGE